VASAYVADGAPLVPAASEAAASQISQRRNERVAAAEAERQQLVLDVAALEEACGVEPTLELAAFKSTVESYTMVDGRNGRKGLGLAFSRLELATYDASLELAAGGINIELAAPGTQDDQLCFMLGDVDSVPADIHRKYSKYYAAAVEEELRTGVSTIEHFRRLAWSSHGGGSVPFAVQLLVAAGATVKGGTWEPQHVETLQSVMEFATCLNDGLSTESSVCFVIRAVDHAAGRESNVWTSLEFTSFFYSLAIAEQQYWARRASIKKNRHEALVLARRARAEDFALDAIELAAGGDVAEEVSPLECLAGAVAALEVSEVDDAEALDDAEEKLEAALEKIRARKAAMGDAIMEELD
jgi:hypothetical protein